MRSTLGSARWLGLLAVLLAGSAWADTMDQYPISETPVYGTVTGSYTNLMASDNVYEAIKEVMNGTSYSWCEWKWTFNIRSGTAQQFRIEAYRPSNSDNDNFQFAYSTDGTNYTNMVSITKTSDNNTDQTYSLPAATSGTVYVRVRDTNRSNGKNSLDTVYIDRMRIVRTYTDASLPATVANLSVSNITANSVQLNWTAPSDADSPCTAYDIRYSTSAITAGNFASATQVTGAPTPASPGTNQNMVVSGLSSNVTYYFALKTSDSHPNWSAISNVPSATTLDNTAPAAITNLATSSPANTSITLTWTAPSDPDSACTAYDIRYSTSTITAGNFSSATQVAGAPTPASGGTNQNMVVSGLSSNTTYYFAMKTSDAVPNWSAISNVATGTTTSASTITFANNTLTYGSPSDLDTTIDPAGLNDVATSYGITKASFQALNPQVVGFNGAPAPTQTLRTLVAYYNPTSTVTFTFPSAMYNYGSMTSVGRGAFSGASLQDAISTVPVQQSDSLYDWFDATITTTGGNGVKALGFCVAFRNDQAVAAGQVLYTLSDATTDTVTLPTLGGGGNPEYVFIGYQAPTGKTITRVQASRTSGAGGGWVTVDDLSFVMAPLADTTPPAAITNLSCSNITASSIQLNWTAPSDPDSACTAYDIRYSTSTITAGNFSSATQVSGAPAPASGGTNQNMVVNGLSSNVTYYFAMKTSDAVPNWSDISNVPSATTLDNTPPAAISNLSCSNITAGSIQLNWTAPSDPDSACTAYDIRYSTSTITAGNFSSATQVSGAPAPASGGTNQNMVVSGLSSNTTYYFAMKTSDAVPNWSAISNVPSATTLDNTPPAAVANLATSSPTSSSITLSWTAPSDPDSACTAYDIRYSTSTITAGNFSSATQVAGAPAPASGGTNQNMVVSGLSAGTTYYFAMKTSDAVPNWSAISNVPTGTTTATTCTWTGSTSQSWSTAGNWNPATVPGAGMIGLVNISSPYPITDADLAGAPTIQVATNGLVWHKGGVTLTTPVNLAGGTWNTGDSWGSSTLNAALSVTAPSVMTGVRGTTLTISGALSGTAQLTFRSTDQYLTDGGDWAISSSNNLFSGGILVDSGNNANLWANASRALGTGDFTVRSTGTLIFGANQDYSGASRTPVLYLEGGSTGMTDHGSGFTIPFNVVVQSAGGTLGGGTWASANTYTGSVTLNGPLTVSGARLYSLASNFTVTGAISGSYPVTVNTTDSYGGGRGVVSLANASNSFSGLTVQMGYLKATSEGALCNGPITLYNPDSMTGLFLDKATDANWTISNIIYGTGTIQVEGGSGFALNTSGTISPGIGAGNAGTVTVQGNLGFNAGATLAIDLNAVDTQNPVADLIAVSGNVSNLSNATLNISVTGDNNTISGRQFTILTCANDLTGQAFGNVTVPGGWSKTMTCGNGFVKVTLTLGGGGDTTPPAAVANLATSNPTSSSITLSWTAPGDDGNTGTATTYDIRYSTSTITAGNFSSATQVTGAPAPQVAGTNQSMTVSGLAASTTYYFAMKTADEVPNWSTISNVPTGTTTAASDTTPPAAVSNLATSSPTSNSITLTWTAPGDDGSTGTATSYDIRYATSQITNDTQFNSATQCTGEPAPLVAGTNQSFVVTGLSASTTYYFAMKTSDEVPNVSALSNSPSGTTTAGADTTPPAAVSNLAAGTPTSGSLTLSWTAPGDDGNTGTATSYDIRYRTGGAVNDANWASATQVSGEPAPQVAGTNQSMIVTGLSASTTYYFAMKTSDEVPNTSAISNSPSGTTSAPGSSTIVAFKRDGGLLAGGAIDSRFNGATVQTVAVADTGLQPYGFGRWYNCGATSVPGGTLLYKFDVSSIPSNSTVNLAQLRLYHTGGNGANGNGDVARIVTHNWTEGTANGTYPGAAGGASQAHPIGYNTDHDQNATGGTTPPLMSWGPNSDSFFNFTEDIGDIGLTVSPSSAPTGTGYHVIPVTVHVQQWVNGTYPNYGFAQLGGNWDFHCSEAGTDQEPVLFVDYTPGGGSDTTPPAAVSNLATSSPTSTSITLSWTAPGDDGNSGTATSYDIRYRIGGPMDDNNWRSATKVTGEPAPAVAGTNQNMTVTGLTPGITYYFAMKTSDEAPLISALSNSPWGTTTTETDTTAPAAISNLAASNPSLGTVTLTWTAPGDDNTTGTATYYDIRYRTGGVVNDSNWASATQVVGEPAPVLAGISQNMTVSGLSPGTTYYFAIKTTDNLANTSAISNSPSATTLSGSSKTLLTPKDFKYLGYYVLQRGGALGDVYAAMGLTHRYVGGQLRFLTMSLLSGFQLIEVAKPANFGDTVSTLTNNWVDIMQGTLGLPTGFVRLGLWYDSAQSRLWSTSAYDYPDPVDAQHGPAIVIRTLNSDGTVSNVQGPWSLQGIDSRRLYGGAQPLPSWFQTTYGTAPYAVGWGGYSSVMASGPRGPVSLGPTFYAIPDPTGYAVYPTDIPNTAFKSLMDHGSATTSGDWYASGWPTSFDRGVRNSDVTDQLDAGAWTSPSPDGLGRWTWDSNLSTGCWIETAAKQGFITIPWLLSGRAWYESSAWHYERLTSEIQVFDPHMLGQAAQGTRAAWNTYPTYRRSVTDESVTQGLGAPVAATYDSTTQTLYVLSTGGGLDARILAYEVANGNAPVSDVALTEISTIGPVTGTRANTETKDGVYESIQESLLGGTSQLDHKWIFNVTGGSSVTFNVKAYHNSNSDGDDFVFAYSTNGTTWTNMVTVTKTADDGNFQTYTMPGGTNGIVYVRVQDSDRTAGHNGLDSIYIDKMYFLSNP